MAFFKFSWPGKKGAADKSAPRSRSAQVESVDVMRSRARHRLIGAAVLVLVGVVGFPLLFDTQPRPIPVDIPIEIPDKGQVAPLMVPGDTAAQPAPAAPSGSVATHASLDKGEEVFEPSAPVAATAPGAATPGAVAPGAVAPGVATPGTAAVSVPMPPVPPLMSPPVAASAVAETPKPATPKVEPPAKPKPEPKPEPKPAPKPEPKPEPKAEPKKADEAARARALLEGRPVSEATASERVVVQVGAFGDADKAREIRAKLAGAGLNAFTTTVSTKDGQRTRVRVGPFNSRAEADKAAARIKGLGLPASVIKP